MRRSLVLEAAIAVAGAGLVTLGVAKCTYTPKLDKRPYIGFNVSGKLPPNHSQDVNRFTYVVQEVMPTNLLATIVGATNVENYIDFVDAEGSWWKMWDSQYDGTLDKIAVDKKVGKIEISIRNGQIINYNCPSEEDAKRIFSHCESLRERIMISGNIPKRLEDYLNRPK